MMGSPTSELGRGADESQHMVTLGRGIYVQQAEVTQGRWKAVSGNVNPSCFQTAGSSSCTTANANDSAPVENIDWYSALAYSNALSVSEGLSPCYALTGCSDPANGWKDGQHAGCTDATFAGLDCTGYRLPTEAEWEYAARAGTLTATYAGDLAGNVETCTNAPAQLRLDGIAWWCRNSGDNGGSTNRRSQPVRGKTANAWGLYDMLGNVWEWVWDRYAPYPGTVTDPLGPSTGSLRLRRGGGFYDGAQGVRAAVRYDYEPSNRNLGLGFRLCRTVSP